MKDLIDRQAALDVLCDDCGNCACPKGKIPRCSYYEKMQAIPTASPWHRVEDDPPDEKEDAIFYYEWTGISGTVYKETSITSLDELMALECRPIAWMEKPEPPKEDA